MLAKRWNTVFVGREAKRDEEEMVVVIKFRRNIFTVRVEKTLNEVLK